MHPAWRQTWRQILKNGGHEPQPRATGAGLAEVERTLAITLPHELRDLYLASDGVYDEQGQWYVIWPLARVVEDNQQSWDGSVPRHLLAFGDNGCGDPFCVARDGSAGVFCWSAIDDEATWLASSVVEFWRGWTGGSITT